MKIGDLVMMRYEMFWHAKTNRRIRYTEAVAIIVEEADGPHGKMKILVDGNVYSVPPSEWSLFTACNTS